MLAVTFVDHFSVMVGIKPCDGAATRTKLSIFLVFNKFPGEWTSTAP